MVMADGSARILLVDDEHAVQKLLSYPLRKEGYDVIPALDGRFEPRPDLDPIADIGGWPRTGTIDSSLNSARAP